MSMHEISPEGVVTLGDALLAHLGVEPGAKLKVEFLPNGIISLRAAKPRPSAQLPGGSQREHGKEQPMTLKRVNYDDNQHRTYAEGRRMPAAVAARWMARFAAHLPARRPLTIVDLGSGVGRLTPALAEAFGGPVYGVEPADRMRAIAEASAAHPAVRYLRGEAAAMPLPDQSADAVLMFLSLHHVPDKAAAAREIARVLKPDGRLLIRTGFGDRLADIWWHRFFPRGREIEEQMFPTLAEVTDLFAAAGLNVLALQEVTEVYAANGLEAAEKLRLRAISPFEHMNEAEIEEGFARLDAWLAAGKADEAPTTFQAELLVLGR